MDLHQQRKENKGTDNELLTYNKLKWNAPSVKS